MIKLDAGHICPGQGGTRGTYPAKKKKSRPLKERVPGENLDLRKLQIFAHGEEEDCAFGQLLQTHDENNRNELVKISKLFMDTHDHEAHKSE